MNLDLTQLIAIAAALGWASGLRLYAVVFLTGMAGWLGWVDLPGGLRILQSPVVLGASGLMLFIEFFVDKIPGLDTVWDTIHTFVRIPAGAALAAATFGGDQTSWVTAAAILGGTLAATSHAAKTVTRASANTSPEPFSNVALSLLGDGIVPFVLWLSWAHPFAFFAVLALAIVVSVATIWLLWRFVGRLVRRARDRAPTTAAVDVVGVVAGLVVMASLPSPAAAQTPVSDFAAGPPSGMYAFASATPATLADLLKPDAARPPVNIVGHLFLPAGSAPVPAVVFMHGSGGIFSAMLEFWPQTLNAAGIAVFAIDSFGPRGVKSTVEDQTQVPYVADVEDAFAALKLLATHPRIDGRRIAIMGTSRGGLTPWRTAVERIIAAQRLPGGLRFAAHVPIYSGGCVGITRLLVKPGVFSKSPMLWVHGDADDYTPAPACREYARKIAEAGTPAEFVLVPGARHAFDIDDTRRHALRRAQKTKETCPLELDIDTFTAYDVRTGKRLLGDDYRNVARDECAALSATVEGDRKARAFTAERIVAFLKMTLPP